MYTRINSELKPINAKAKITFSFKAGLSDCFEKRDHSFTRWPEIVFKQKGVVLIFALLLILLTSSAQQ